MNRLNIHTRLTEIGKVAREAREANRDEQQRDLLVALDVIELHLQAIRAEIKPEVAK